MINHYPNPNPNQWSEAHAAQPWAYYPTNGYTFNNSYVYLVPSLFDSSLNQSLSASLLLPTYCR